MIKHGCARRIAEEGGEHGSKLGGDDVEQG
jgi:hypothetical protein